MSFYEAVEPATIVCRGPLDFDFDEGMGLFLVRDPSLTVVRAFKPADLHQSIANAARCYAMWRERETAEVIEFPSKAAG